MDTFTRAYITAALFTELDDDNQPLDKNYTIDDLTTAARNLMTSDCAGFLEAHAEQIGTELERAGHDFWLTRNGHGAGFWDGDWPAPIGQDLSIAAKKYGSAYLYVWDQDNRLYYYTEK
jgi:hypothetical protein